MKDHLLLHLRRQEDSQKSAFPTSEVFLSSRVVGAILQHTGTSTGKGTGMLSKESHGQGAGLEHTHGAVPRGLTIERNCLKLQLLCVAFPEVLSSLPKLGHVQHRHLARLEEDLAAVKKE